MVLKLILSKLPGPCALAEAGVEETSLCPLVPRVATQGASQVPIGCQSQFSVSAPAGAVAEEPSPQLESFGTESSTHSLSYSIPRFKAIPALLCCVALDSTSPPGPVLALQGNREAGWDNRLINCRWLAQRLEAPFPCPCLAPHRGDSPPLCRTKGERRGRKSTFHSSEPLCRTALKCSPLRMQNRGTAARGQQTPGTRDPEHMGVQSE